MKATKIYEKKNCDIWMNERKWKIWPSAECRWWMQKKYIWMNERSRKMPCSPKNATKKRAKVSRILRNSPIFPKFPPQDPTIIITFEHSSVKSLCFETECVNERDIFLWKKSWIWRPNCDGKPAIHRHVRLARFCPALRYLPGFWTPRISHGTYIHTRLRLGWRE